MSKAKKRTKKLLKQLDEGIDKMQDSQEFKELLKFYSKFHDYSFRNTILIQMQCPVASLVKGYKQWKELDRYVLPADEREEKDCRTDPIRILAPQFYFKDKQIIKNQEELEQAKEKANNNKTYKIKKENGKVKLQQKQIYFKYVNVYDISQTDGKPIPSMNLDLKNNFAELKSILTNYCNTNNLDLQFKELPGQREGYQRGNKIVINKNKNETTQASIIIHEIAHYKLHNGLNGELSKELMEMEAEAVAYVVLKHFDIENTSDKYLAGYKKDHNVKNSLDRITKTSDKLIEYIENKVKKDKNQQKTA